MILYFSGTGTCEFIAKSLAKELCDRAISITECKEITLNDGEKLGLITPTYFWGLPSIVEEFLSSVKINNAENAYIYCVTAYGTTNGGVDYFTDKILKGKGLKLSASFGIKTVDNYTPLFSVNDKNKIQRELVAEAEQILRLITFVKEARREFIVKDRKSVFMSKCARSFYNKARKTAKFKVSSDCIGCGICEKLCPTNAIELSGGKPQWTKDKCTLCLSCLHRCPSFAISYANKTQKKGQYVHPKFND